MLTSERDPGASRTQTYRWIKHSSADSIEEPHIDRNRTTKPKSDEEDNQQVWWSISISRRWSMCNLGNCKCKEQKHECAGKFRNECGYIVAMCFGQKPHDCTSLTDEPAFDSHVVWREATGRVDNESSSLTRNLRSIGAESDIYLSDGTISRKPTARWTIVLRARTCGHTPPSLPLLMTQHSGHNAEAGAFHRAKIRLAWTNIHLSYHLTRDQFKTRDRV